MVQLFNFAYFVPLIIIAVITVFLVLFTRKKSQKFNYNLIFIILLVNAILHFLKIFIPTVDYFYDLPYSIARISLENICAVSVVSFPILFLLKNKYAYDAIFYIGILSALAALLMPTGAFNRELNNFTNIIEVIRYYLCHTPLLICPILMISNKIHHLSYRRMYVAGLAFMINVSIVFLNALLLKGSGVINCTWEQFFSRNYCNPGLVFGPNKMMYDAGMKYVSMLVPNFLKYTTSSGDLGYIPVLWYITPIFLIATIATLIGMIFDHKKVKKDYRYLCAKYRLIKIAHRMKHDKE